MQRTVVHTSVLTLLVCTTLTTALLAQTRTLFDDDFDTNHLLWPEQSGPTYSSYVRDGEYHVRSDQDNGSYVVLNALPPLSSPEWTMQARMRRVSGATRDGFGLVFHAASSDRCYVFLASTNGYCCVYRLQESDVALIVPWRQVYGSRTPGEWNDFAIHRVADVLAFYLNSECVGSVTYSEFPAFGSKTGFIVSTKMELAIDRLWVSERTDVPQILSVDDKDYSPGKVNLGPQVNSVHTELSALISADNSTLYFARRGHERNTQSPEMDDIWLSRRSADRSWLEAINVGAPLNNGGSNTVISVTPDNNTLLLYGTYNPDGSAKSSGVSISHRSKSGWDVPRELVIDQYINLNEHEEYCLSPDATVLMMALERRDTRGSKDLYVSFRTTDSSFSEPVHIESLSTEGSETAPYIASDGLTLYFSTNGLPGYGSQDIYVTKRLDSTWMNWSAPRNLGSKINTRYFDAYFRTNTRGDSAYMTSYAESIGGGDIVRVAVPTAAQPSPVCLVSGVVLDAKTKKPLSAGVVYEILSTGREAGIARSSPTDGRYAIVLPAGNLYGFRAEVHSYYPVSEQLDTRSLNKYGELHRDLLLVPVEAKAKIRLNNLFFDFGQYEIRPESISELQRLISFIRANPTIHISVEGHTDDVGSDADNRTLSLNRAKAVVEYLEGNGISGARLQVKGYGKSRPISENKSEVQRQQNRRVEFVIIRQ